MAPDTAMIPTAAEEPRYRTIVGTGGIGWGINVALEGNDTLGREESRAVKLLEARDYCKLHIVFHYAQRLLGPGVPVVAIGSVGDDEAGGRLRAEMAAVGLDLRHVAVARHNPTLFAVSFAYPDGDGGNLTTRGSASDDVGPDAIRAARDRLSAFPGKTIAVALPEVPLSARRELLALATQAGAFRVASFVSGEAGDALRTGTLEMVDLLVLNRDEAQAFALARGAHRLSDAESAIRKLSELFPGISLIVTAGASGSWSWDGRTIGHAPAVAPRVIGTAGAGDAHLAGTLVGLVHGMRLHEANRVGALVSGLAVGSEHAIHPDLDGPMLMEAATRSDVRLPAALIELHRG